MIRKKDAKETADTATPGFDEYIRMYRDHSKNPMKIILSFYKGSGFDILKSFFAFVIKQMPVWVIPIVTSNVINVVTKPQEHQMYELWINLAVGILFISENTIFSYFYAKAYNKVIRRIESTLRGVMIKKLQQLSITFHKEIQAGKLQSKIMRDVENVELLLHQAYMSLLAIFLDITVAITVIISKSPLVLLFFVASIPVAVSIVAIFKKSIESRNKEFREEMEETQAAVGEMLDRMPVTRAHGLQQTEIQRMEGRLERVRISGYRLDIVNTVFSAVSWVVFQIFQLLCLGFTGYLAFRGDISVGDVVLFQAYFAQIINQVAALISLMPVISKGVESVKSVGEIITADDVEEDNHLQPPCTVEGNVEFRDVAYRYKQGEKLILNNFSMTVRAGESIALAGGSGMGKSTVLNLLIGFGKPEGGSVRVDGKLLQDMNMNDYRGQIAVVPQNTILFSGSIRDNITYGLEAVNPEKLKEVMRDVGLDEWISTLPEGLDTRVGAKGEEIVTSQRQRISIARALIRDPRIILFDEATSALDSMAEQKVQQAVKKMMHNRTVIMAAKKVSTLKGADRIIVINDGTAAEEGTYEELMSAGKLFPDLVRNQE